MASSSYHTDTFNDRVQLIEFWFGTINKIDETMNWTYRLQLPKSGWCNGIITSQIFGIKLKIGAGSIKKHKIEESTSGLMAGCICVQLLTSGSCLYWKFRIKDTTEQLGKKHMKSKIILVNSFYINRIAPKIVAQTARKKENPCMDYKN